MSAAAIRAHAAESVKALGYPATDANVADYLALTLATILPAVSLAQLRIMPKPTAYAVPPKRDPGDIR